MKKRIYSLFMLVLILAFSCMSVFAESSNNNYVVDDADYLTSDEEYSIQTELQALSDKYEMAFVLYTYDGITDEWDAKACADNFFDYHEYGEDGVLLLISYCGTPNMTGYNYCYISTTGKCIKMLSDERIDTILDKVAPNITAGNIKAAADGYVSGLKDWMAARFRNYILSCIIILVVVFIIVLIVHASIASKLKSVHKKAEADSYVLQNSINFFNRYDNFVTKNVTRVKIETNSGGTRSGGGGGGHGGHGRSC